MIKTLSSLHGLHDKSAILRLDTDVDIDDGKVTDATRLTAGLKSLHVLREKGASVNIIGHLGRPEGQDPKFTMEPVAKWFAKEFDHDVKEIKIGSLKGWEVGPGINLIENIRYFAEEEKNDEKFARDLSLLGNIYVNDSFAVSHRAHASMVGVAKWLPSYAGIHLEKEIEVLGNVLSKPKRPLHVIIGGAKIETKLPMVSKMHSVADYVLVGGEIAEQTRILLSEQHKKITGQRSAIIVADLVDSGFDVTPNSAENFCQILEGAATIVWNGPVGLIRKKKDRHGEDTEAGTRMIAEFVAKSDAYTVVGGGDTLSYLSELNLLDKFDFVSTGGGAMLEFLSGKKLPAIEVLEK